MKIEIETKLTIELEGLTSVEHLKAILQYFLANEDNASSDEGDTAATMLESLR